MKINVSDVEIEIERNPDEDVILELLAEFIKTLNKEKKEKLLSLLSQSDIDEYCEISGAKLIKKSAPNL